MRRMGQTGLRDKYLEMRRDGMSKLEASENLEINVSDSTLYRWEHWLRVEREKERDGRTENEVLPASFTT
jgi:hypothetical protein